MSLITRCPTCETMFRVVPDQLRVSEGWVRCGQCAEVFDATQNMVPPPGASAASIAAAPPPPEATSTPPTAPPAAAAQPDKAFPAPADQEAHEPGSLDDPQTDPQTVLVPPEDIDSVDTASPAERDFQPTAPPSLAADADPLIGMPREAGFGPPPSFLQDEPPASIWQRPAFRLSLAVLLVVLLALLAMQFLVKERDRVAALHPAMRPVLEALCGLADCRIGPLRQIESIVIDSSSFSRVRDDDYRLGFSLKNTAPIDVAMPAIELSLTDPQDQPVIRRVILPTEFGARSASLASASIWTGSLALTVQPDIGAQRIAGYRLLAFYP